MVLAKLVYSDEIRLLRLNPGSPQDELQGELITARLSAHPAFEAISYRYGDPDEENPQCICWGNQKLYIGNNLAGALQHFRSATEIRTMWVDQLCVDQSCPDERFQQLQLFGDIFSQAHTVLIWLGQADEKSEQAMDLFEKLVERLRQVDQQLQQHGSANTEVIKSRQQDAQVLKDFFKKDWFSRVWTLQEAALAKGAEVWCGNKMLPFSLFAGFFEKADNDDRSHWASAVHAINTGLGGDDPLNPIRSAFQTISTVSKLKLSANLSSARILNIIRSLDSTEQVDRVWSTLRFLPSEIIAALSPYRNTKDTAQLYHVLAKIALEHGEAGCLGAAGLTLQRHTYQLATSNEDRISLTEPASPLADDRPMLILPSWVPDWTFKVRVHALWVLNDDCMQKCGRPLYRAGGQSWKAGNVSLVNSDKYLRIEAKILEDKVGTMVPPFTIPLIPKNTEARPDVASFVDDQIQKLDDQMQECFQMASHCTGYTSTKFACRSTLVGSMVSNGISATTAGTLIHATDVQIDFMFDNYEVTRRVLRLLRTANSPAEQMAALFALSPEESTRFREISQGNVVCDGVKINPTYVAAAFAEMCKVRRFFVSDTKHYMGIAPDITQQGDRICVIPGCCAPFVIRPMGGCWQLIGECYVHGIMDGEIMEDTTMPLTPVEFV